MGHLGFVHGGDGESGKGKKTDEKRQARDYEAHGIHSFRGWRPTNRRVAARTARRRATKSVMERKVATSAE
jgi:hypothetical protein